MVRRAVEAKVYAERDRAPCRVLRVAIETYLSVHISCLARTLTAPPPGSTLITHLVRRLGLQFREDVPRLVLCSERHGGLDNRKKCGR